MYKVTNKLLSVMALFCWVFSTLETSSAKGIVRDWQDISSAVRLSSTSNVSTGKSNWEMFSDSDLDVSLSYPGSWYRQDDPTFRTPVPVSGAFERRVVFSTFDEPLL